LHIPLLQSNFYNQSVSKKMLQVNLLLNILTFF